MYKKDDTLPILLVAGLLGYAVGKIFSRQNAMVDITPATEDNKTRLALEKLDATDATMH